MQPVDVEEGRRYLAHRVRTAGGNPDVIEPDAVELVLEEAQGRLRAIDDVCTQALYAGFIARDQVITKTHIENVIAERRILRY